MAVRFRLLTEADVLAWAGQRGLANNTKRNRLSRVCTFLCFAPVVRDRWGVSSETRSGSALVQNSSSPTRRPG